MKAFRKRLPLLVVLALGFWGGLRTFRSAAAEAAVSTNSAAAARAFSILSIVTNRAPLAPLAFHKLPLGSIRPEGWLRQQLLFMANSLTGHLPEVSKWCRFQGSAWSGKEGEGQYGWEELPYWLRGYTDLGYILRDPRILNESRAWIDSILAHQQTNGYFGPKTNMALPDIWPNMLVLETLRSHFEATADPRVPAFMTRYFHWLAAVPKEKLLPDSWQKWRGGDNLGSIYWLYNRTGEAWLLELAKANHDRTADWTGGIPTWHGVNLAQGFREPAQYSLQSREPAHLDAALRNYQRIMGKFGQVPGGMFGADENAREGHTGPRQGAETCSMVEFMNSDELLLGITGDPVWADRCEEIAFNSLPAAMTPDLRGLHYLTAPNQIQLDRTNKAPMIENSGDMFSYNPWLYRCCQHNSAMGWPRYAEHLWMGTPGRGLAAVLYGACSVTARVGLGRDVRVTETTDYPFDETIQFAIAAAGPTQFPLVLRVPGWCDKPVVRVNGQALSAVKPSKGWITLDRLWRNGDQATLELPMRTSVRTWESNRRAVSIDRGPLTYSLKIGERWQRYAGTDRWPAFEVFPTTPWNYALISPTQTAAAFTFVKTPGPLAAQPFSGENAPVSLRARARRLPAWTQERNGLAGEFGQSPVRSDAPIEEVTLIPMGCARLRVSVFPTVAN